MGLIPRSLKLRLILRLVVEAFEEIDPKEIGGQINREMDARFTKPLADKTQKRIATWLRAVASALEA